MLDVATALLIRWSERRYIKDLFSRAYLLGADNPGNGAALSANYLHFARWTWTLLMLLMMLLHAVSGHLWGAMRLSIHTAINEIEIG